MDKIWDSLRSRAARIISRRQPRGGVRTAVVRTQDVGDDGVKVIYDYDVTVCEDVVTEYLSRMGAR